jgi:hypothetical protein
MIVVEAELCFTADPNPTYTPSLAANPSLGEHDVHSQNLPAAELISRHKLLDLPNCLFRDIGPKLMWWY